MRDLFGTKLELRLGDALDSEIDRKVADLVPTGRPGRGLAPGKLHFLAALPRIDSDPSADTLGDGVSDLVKRIAAAWAGPVGPKLRLLPDRIALADVRRLTATPPEGRRLLLAVNERDLGAVALDPDAEPHLLVFGDDRSGKSSLLRTYVSEIARTRTPKQAQLIVVDYRRSLLGEVPEDYLLNYLTSATQAQPALADLAAYLQNRIPGPDVTPDQLRNRSWWQGAEVFVIVDDYDLVATQQSSPVAALQPLLAQARDVGLHLVVARRLRRRVPRPLRTGHPVPARPRDARAAALGQPGRGSPARQRASRAVRARAGSARDPRSRGRGDPGGVDGADRMIGVRRHLCVWTPGPLSLKPGRSSMLYVASNVRT